MPNLVCSGPGPHVPANGILGTSDGVISSGLLCGSLACKPQPDPREAKMIATQAQVEGALARVEEIVQGGQALASQANALSGQNTAWTVAQQKAVAVALRDICDAVSDMAVGVGGLIREVRNLYDA